MVNNYGDDNIVIDWNTPEAQALVTAMEQLAKARIHRAIDELAEAIANQNSTVRQLRALYRMACIISNSHLLYIGGIDYSHCSETLGL